MTEYVRVTPGQPDLIESLVVYLTKYDGDKLLRILMGADHDKPGRIRRVVTDTVEERPRWHAFIVATDDGEIIGVVHYSVESCAFLGGNEYQVLWVHIDPAVDPLYAVEVQEKLLDASYRDDDDM